MKNGHTIQEIYDIMNYGKDTDRLEQAIYLNDILHFIEGKNKIGIFNYTKGNITILETVVRSYLKLDKSLKEQSLSSKNQIIALFDELGLLKSRLKLKNN